MSYSQELRDRLKAIKAAERQGQSAREVNHARQEAWETYLDERVRDHRMEFYVNPDGAGSSYPGEAS